jgi:hypothetical protein
VKHINHVRENTSLRSVAIYHYRDMHAGSTSAAAAAAAAAAATATATAAAGTTSTPSAEDLMRSGAAGMGRGIDPCDGKGTWRASTVAGEVTATFIQAAHAVTLSRRTSDFEDLFVLYPGQV